MGRHTIQSQPIGSINSAPPSEITPLIRPSDNLTLVQVGAGKLIKDILRIATALPTGAGQVYSTVGTIAVLTRPSLYIAIPVFGGGMITLSSEILDVLKSRYEDNEVIKRLAEVMKAPKDKVIAYLGDLGFVWSMLTTVAAEISGQAYMHNNFAKFVAPLPSAISAGFVRYVLYQRENKKEINRAMMIFADTIKGASSSTFFTGLLQQQSILSPSSWVPSACIASMGLLGLVAGLLDKSSPAVAKKLVHVIDIVSHLSLATSVFTFANDIFAASNHNKLPEGFFYSNLGVSALYFVLLTVMMTMSWCAEENSGEFVADIENQHRLTVEEVSEDQDLVYRSEEEGRISLLIPAGETANAAEVDETGYEADRSMRDDQ